MYLLLGRWFLSQIPLTCTERTMPDDAKNEVYLQHRLNHVVTCNDMVVLHMCHAGCDRYNN